MKTILLWRLIVLFSGGTICTEFIRRIRWRLAIAHYCIVRSDFGGTRVWNTKVHRRYQADAGSTAKLLLQSDWLSRQQFLHLQLGLHYSCLPHSKSDVDCCLLWIGIRFVQFVLIFNFVKHTELKFGDYVFPHWADEIGWMLFLVSVIWIPILAIGSIIYAVVRRKARMTLSAIYEIDAFWKQFLGRPLANSSKFIVVACKGWRRSSARGCPLSTNWSIIS